MEHIHQSINNEVEKKIIEHGSKSGVFSLDCMDLKEVPSSIGNLTNLETLYLGSNQLKVLPSSIGNLTTLKELNLLRNKLKEVPSSIGNLTNLQKLPLSGNELKEVPLSIGNLTNLQTLKLDYNELKEVPSSIGNLSNLKELCLECNELKEVPSSIGNLTNLQTLSLHSNKLKEIPSSIGNLTNLKELSLSNNELKEVPSSIGNLTKLQNLLLYNNKLTEIPQSITRLTNLTHLYIVYGKGNKDLIYPPYSLIEPFPFNEEKQAEVVLEYCRTHGPPISSSLIKEEGEGEVVTSRVIFEDFDTTPKSSLEDIIDYKPTKSCPEYILQACSALSIPDKRANTLLKDCKRIASYKYKSMKGSSLKILPPQQLLAVVCYTFEIMGAGKEDQFYTRLNAALRDRNTEILKQAKGYLHFLLKSLMELPDFEGMVYRGIPKHHIKTLKKNYKSGLSVHWSGISSTTTDKKVAISFAKEGGVLMKVHIHQGKEINHYSAVSSENEVIILPNTMLNIATNLHKKKDMLVIRLTETREEDTVIDFGD